MPILVIEVASGITRQRDQGKKRQFYLDIGVAEYWVVDRQSRSIQVVRAGTDDVMERGTVAWRPVGADEPLVVDVPKIFADAMGEV